MEGHGEMSLIGENFDPSLVGRIKNEEHENRSGSDDFEGASGDYQRQRKKKYERHTPNQIQELESFFKECPHPDKEQRKELSRRLGLESRQVKFWFQNKRTQRKGQLEHHDNMILRRERDKLQDENSKIKEAMLNPACSNCGGPAVPGKISLEEHQLRIENTRLKDELNRLCAIVNNFMGGPISPLASPMAPSGPNVDLELSIGMNGLGVSSRLPRRLDSGCGGSSTPPAMPLIRSPMALMDSEVQLEGSWVIELAVSAMKELINMCQADSSLWINNSDGEKETLNHDEYARIFSSSIGSIPNGYVTEATKETGLVIMNSLNLVEILMDVCGWFKVFSSMVTSATTLKVISNGIAGTRNGALHVMQAEVQVLSPLVPARQLRFLRFCKQYAEGLWVVVDVSVDIGRNTGNASPFMGCRRLPSGCVIQDMRNGYSKVTWVEHSQYDETAVHQLFRPLLNSGIAFGAKRWMATLQRQCEYIVSLMFPYIMQEIPGMSLAGRRSMLELAESMTENFYSGIFDLSTRNWDSLQVVNSGGVIKVMTQKNVDVHSDPPAIVLSAATSVWMPVSRQRLFNFLQNEQMLNVRDILFTGVVLEELLHIPKGLEHGNGVFLFRSCPMNDNEATMILQETCTDRSISMIVYAPVDVESLNVIIAGGDSTCAALMPSGFVILPDGYPGSGYGSEPDNNNWTSLRSGDDDGEDGGSCLLTVGFQILVNDFPSAKLTVEAVGTVNNLISCTIQRIKTALRVP